MTTVEAKRYSKRAREHDDLTWSESVDYTNRAEGIDLDRVLAQARRTYHPASQGDRDRLGKAVRR